MGFRHQPPLLWPLLVVFALGFSLWSASGQSKEPSPQPGSSAAGTPTFSENEALDILDDLQAALQSYNRKRFLAAFDTARMPNFAGFRNQVNALFAKYDSFTVTYHLMQTAMEAKNGVVLADFGLDGTSNSNEMLDLRRHTQLRLLLAWNGKEWKIVNLSPRAVFSSQ